MMETIFWVSVFLLFYVYIGYALVLKLFQAMFGKSRIDVEPVPGYKPAVSVIIAAYNEEKVITGRIDNLLELEYPREKLEIIVASDGSTDRTVEAARKYEQVRVLDFRQNRGRAAIQNDSVGEACGDIVVFTDAETEFEKDFMEKVAKRFADESTGCVVGNLVYRTGNTSISESEGSYWKYEKRLREMESGMGILATASGACMAVRKGMWRELTPIDDCDFTTPLDVVLQGGKVVYEPEALAYDAPPMTMKGELRTRIRQTSKNLAGTLKRWGWKGVVSHPAVSWGLVSHKILRWLSPFFMAGVLGSNLFLLDSGLVYQASISLQALFCLAAAVGMAGAVLRIRFPVASAAFAFCVASLGMGIGVIKGLSGKAPARFGKAE